MEEKYIDSAYGRLYLSPERADLFYKIVGKYIHNLFIELRENNIIPSHLSLEKTVVREKKVVDTIQQERLKQYQEKAMQNCQKEIP